MTKKQKKTLKRIIAAAMLTVLLALLFHFVELPWFVQLVLWLVPVLRRRQEPFEHHRTDGHPPRQREFGGRGRQRLRR